MVLLVLIGIGHGEIRDGTIEHVAVAHIAAEQTSRIVVDSRSAYWQNSAGE